MGNWDTTPRGRVTVTRQAHNLKIAGSIPAPATRKILDVVELLEDAAIPPYRLVGFVVRQLESRAVMGDLIADLVRFPSVV